jgi:hypothetical protein
MSQATARRGRNTFLIYGIAGALIVLWWAALSFLGIDLDSGNEGRIMLGTVAVLVLAGAMARDPFGILCLIVFSMPFSLGVLQIEIGIMTFNPYTLGIAGALLFAIAGVGMRMIRYRPAPEDLVALLLGFSFLLSTLRAPNLVEAGYLAFHGVFIPIITYLALKTLIRTPDQYHKVLVAFVGGIVAFAVYGLVQFAKDTQRLHILEMPPISAAALITSALIIIVYSGWWRKLPGLLAILTLFAALLTTFSRGYLVLLFLTPVIFYILRRGHGTKMITTILAATLLGTLVFAKAQEQFYVRGVDREHEQSAERITDLDYWKSSLYGRARYYAVGIREFSKSPIFGNGFHMGFSSEDGRAVVWHNFHVEWLEYGGISAYLLYVMLLIIHFRGVSRDARTQRAIAVNLTVLFTVLLNGLTNSFTAGISPYIGFLMMALNRAHQRAALGNPSARANP